MAVEVIVTLPESDMLQDTDVFMAGDVVSVPEEAEDSVGDLLDGPITPSSPEDMFLSTHHMEWMHRRS